MKEQLGKEKKHMSRQTYNAKELAELLGVSEGKSYQFIRQMNAELTAKGFLTVRGKIPKAYVEKRFFGGIAGVQEVTNA